MTAPTRIGLLIGGCLAAAAAAGAAYALQFFTGAPADRFGLLLNTPALLAKVEEAVFTAAAGVGWLAIVALLIWAIRVVAVAIVAKGPPRRPVADPRPLVSAIPPLPTALRPIDSPGPAEQLPDGPPGPTALQRAARGAGTVAVTVATLLFRGGLTAVQAASEHVHRPGTVTFEAQERPGR